MLLEGVLKNKWALSRQKRIRRYHSNIEESESKAMSIGPVRQEPPPQRVAPQQQKEPPRPPEVQPPPAARPQEPDKGRHVDRMA